MDKQLFKRCWRIAVEAYRVYVGEQKPRLYAKPALFSRLSTLVNITNKIGHYHSQIARSKSRSKHYFEDFEFALDSLRSSVMFNNTNLLCGSRWVPNFARGLYSLITEDMVELSETESTITFVVEDVEIEDVSLGDFRVEKSLIHVTESSITSITNPDLGVPHPHIQGSNPCLGDAAATLRAAWSEGDIASVVDIYDAYLRSYNPDSAYKKIHEIHGYVCKDCGRQDERMDICESCDEPSCCTISCNKCGRPTTCGGCSELRLCASCECDFCKDCSVSCPECGDTVCCRCSIRCDECTDDFCSTCTEDGVCQTCVMKLKKAEAEEKEKTSVPSE